MPEEDLPVAQSRVLILDDHPIIGFGLQAALQKHFSQTKVAHEPRHALAEIQNWKPDLLILDINLHQTSGLEFLALLKEKNIPLKTIVFSQVDEPLIWKKITRFNICAALTKDSPLDDLVQLAKKALHTNTLHLHSSVQTLLETTHPVLSTRELETVQLLCEGLTNKEIACKLGCSDLTIKAHKASAMKKTQTKNSAELVGWYLSCAREFN